MSILERMRGSTDSTPMQIVLVLIVVAFIGWFSLPQAETVQVAVEVNGERVLRAEYGQRYYQELQAAQQQARRRFSEEEEQELQLRVKDMIATELAVSQEAENLGYHVSPEEVARAIKADPAYQTSDGRFDKELYEDALKSSGRSRSDYESDYRDRLLRDKLRDAITLGVHVPQSTVLKRYNEALTTLDLSYVRVDPVAVAESMPITDEERAAWIASNGDKLQAAYDKDRALKYDLPERVQLATIRLKVSGGDTEALTERLQSVRAEIEAGADFADMARRWSEDRSATAGGDLGEQRVPTLTTKVREAIADLQVGQVTPVLDEGLEVSLYKVLDRIPAQVTPLQDVQDELADVAMRAERTRQYAERLASAWEGGSLPQDLLDQAGAEVEPLPGVSAFQYQAPAGTPPQDAVDAVKDSEAGAVAGPFSRPGKDGDVLFVVRLDGKNLPDPDGTEQAPGGVAQFRQLTESAEREQVWSAYTQSLLAAAQVDTGGGEAQQGGWRSYLPDLSWLLPQSE